MFPDDPSDSPFATPRSSLPPLRPRGRSPCSLSPAPCPLLPFRVLLVLFPFSSLPALPLVALFLSPFFFARSKVSRFDFAHLAAIFVWPLRHSEHYVPFSLSFCLSLFCSPFHAARERTRRRVLDSRFLARVLFFPSSPGFISCRYTVSRAVSCQPP